MKKLFYGAAALVLMTACGNNQQNLVIGDPVYVGEQTVVEVNEPATPNCPAYVVVNNPEVDMSAFPIDKDGYYVIFNGNMGRIMCLQDGSSRTERSSSWVPD